MKSSFIELKAPDDPLDVESPLETDVKPEVGSVDEPEFEPVDEPKA